MKASLVAKFSGSFLAVCSAGAAFCLKGENPFGHTIFWFFLLCSLADVLLELSFVPGMLLFGLAHIFLILYFRGIAPPVWWSWILWAAACALAAWLFRREIPRLGVLVVPFCLYPGILSGSLALALVLPFLAGPVWWMSAVGAFSFFVSDMMVAKDELSDRASDRQKPIMLLYWAALYLLAAPLWFL